MAMLCRVQCRRIINGKTTRKPQHNHFNDLLNAMRLESHKKRLLNVCVCVWLIERKQCAYLCCFPHQIYAHERERERFLFRTTRNICLMSVVK